MRPSEIDRLLMPNTYVKQLAQEFGDHARLTAGTGIASTEIEHYAKPVTVAQHLQVVRNALAIAERPEWYLQWGQRMGEHFHGAVSAAWLSAPTLGAGLDAFLKYIPSRVPYLHWQGHRDDETFCAEVTELVDLGPVRAMLIEVPMIVMHEYTRTIRPGSIAGARIELAYRPTPHCYLYSNWFQCPVAFESSRNALVIPHQWRAIDNVGFDEGVWQAALARCEILCATTEERDALTRVRQLLFDGFERRLNDGSPPSLETVAERLHCSARTLIRRLRSMDTTYQQVIDEVQQQRARELLSNERLRIHEVAAALGYQDAAGFVRSFKRWYGMTPGDYRKQIVDPPL
ncbi:MAG: AraC family transcriptional regulator ligand-binding domain-containing protein [Gammaproteobacteria bacterium]|nr:AraC family transcriptional regulator ligand-binding domain-containing protein [Gammaproteobacteria bacterium]